MRLFNVCTRNFILNTELVTGIVGKPNIRALVRARSRDALSFKVAHIISSSDPRSIYRHK